MYVKELEADYQLMTFSSFHSICFFLECGGWKKFVVVFFPSLIISFFQDITVFVSLPMTGLFPTGGVLAQSIEIAVEDINQNNSVLPNHQLVLHIRDTKCHPGSFLSFHGVHVPSFIFFAFRNGVRISGRGIP